MLKFTKRRSIRDKKTKTEISQTKFIPYEGHWDENIIYTKDKELLFYDLNDKVSYNLTKIYLIYSS
jgi:hypothetical protein